MPCWPSVRNFLPSRRIRVCFLPWHCHGVRLYADRLRGSFGIPCVFLRLFPRAIVPIVAGILYPNGMIFMLEIQKHFSTNQLIVCAVSLATSDVADRMNDKVC